MKFVPYMTIKDSIEMTHTIPKGNEDIFVYFEQADPVFFFKSALFNLDKMTLEKREGFTDEELAKLVNIMRDNRNSIFKYAKVGGIDCA